MIPASDQVSGRRVRIQLTTSYVVLLLLIAAAVAAAYLNSKINAQNYSRFVDTVELESDLEHTANLVVDLQYGMRTAVLSGNDQDYTAAATGLASEIDRLHTLESKYPEHQTRLTELDRLLQAQLIWRAEVIKVARGKGIEAWQKALAEHALRREMEESRVIVHDMIVALNKEQLRRHTESTDSERHTSWILGMLGAIMISILTGVFFLLRHHLVRRMRAEADLRASEQNLAVTLSSIGDGVLVTDPEGRVTRLNPVAEKLTGWSDTEARGRPVQEIFNIFNEDTRTPADIPVMAVLATGAVVGVADHTALVARDGSKRSIADSAAPIRRPGEPLLGAVMVFRDVTEERCNTNALRERTAALEAANKELEAFSYSVSHDLRAPLRHIAGYVELLSMDSAGRLPPDSQHYLKTIAESGAEMGQLIDELLEFSRMGRAELAETNVVFDDLVQDVRHGFDTPPLQRNIVWKIAPLPSVVGDPAMLRQVLVNLLSNAIKYTRPRDPAIIEIGCNGREHDRIVLFVRDNGVGFDPRFVDKLFGVFQRLHHSDEFEGTGIGLANVRRIITRHGGRVWAESVLNQGACFYFTLRTMSAA